MSEFKKYFTARSHVFMRPYVPGEEVRWVDKVHVSPRDGATGSPKAGDYIAYTAEKPENQFLVSAENYKSYEATGEGETVSREEIDGEQGKSEPMVRDPLKNAEAQRQTEQEAEKSEEEGEKASEPNPAPKPTEAPKKDDKPAETKPAGLNIPAKK